MNLIISGHMLLKVPFQIINENNKIRLSVIYPEEPGQGPVIRSLFTAEKHRNYILWSCQKVCEDLTFLLDGIYIRFGIKLFRQNMDIPMGTNCAPLVAVMKETS